MSSMSNSSSLDSAFFSKPIPNPKLKTKLDPESSENCNWNLVFTRFGKYFFHNPQTGQRSWLPPQNVLKVLKESFTPTEREMFFDPFYHSEEKEEEYVDDEEDNTKNITDIIENKKRDDKLNSDSIAAEEEFKLYLLKNSIDPFAPWPMIQSLHSHCQQFQAIPSEKRRQDLFAQACPVLIQMHREASKQKLAEAKEWWRTILNNYKNEMNWFQLVKKLKGHAKFKLLNEKECEKEFKSV